VIGQGPISSHISLRNSEGKDSSLISARRLGDDIQRDALAVGCQLANNPRGNGSLMVECRTGSGCLARRVKIRII